VVEPRLAGWWHEVCCFRRQVLERRNLWVLDSPPVVFGYAIEVLVRRRRYLRSRPWAS